MRVVVALGGNALLPRGAPARADTQRQNVAVAAQALAALVEHHTLVVTHGNGPQVGLLALQAEAYGDVEPYPLDILGAESEGMIGYLVEQELANRLPGRDVVTLLTQVVVDSDDPAMAAPSKPIGPVYPRSKAAALKRRGWSVGRDGDHVRRVVPSPEPRRIVELRAIRLLVEAGVLVVCAGGGGIPVVETASGGRSGVEAVIDKDLAASLLAVELGAEALLLLTDVGAVEAGWQTPAARRIARATPEELRRHHFEPGSMAPKVEAACRFVEATGGRSGIGRLSDAAAILAGAAGTAVLAP